MKAQGILVHSYHEARGTSLIELLVVMAIVLLVSVSVFSMLDRGLQDTTLSQTVAEANESTRASMAFMVRDFIASGAEITVGGIPVPASFLPSRVLYPITPAPNQGPTINEQPTDRVLIAYNQLALQGLDTNQQDIVYKINGVGAISPSGDKITLNTSILPGLSQPNPDTSTLQVGDILLIKGNSGTISALAYVTGIRDAATINFSNGDPLGLNASGSTSPLAALSCAKISQLSNCIDNAVAFKVNIVQYYIDNTGPNPTLMRRLNGQTPTELGLNIENLKINYVLEDGTMSPNPANPTSIRKAAIFLMGRSTHPSRQDQAYYRFPLSCQVATRNIAYMPKLN